MSKQQRYYREDGEVSKSGKTIVRTSKSGRKYYHNPTKYRERKEEEQRKIMEKGGEPTRKPYEHTKQRSTPICSDPKSEAYMRYYEKKKEIRSEYPNWVHMKRDQYREYYKRIWNLILFDEDFQQWFRVDSKTLAEKEEDQWWEERKRKDENYDGRGDY